MELVTINSKKYPSSYDQPSDDLIKWKLLKSPEKYSHASQLTKHISSTKLEGNTIIQIQKWWDSILSAFFQSLSTNKRWQP